MIIIVKTITFYVCEVCSERHCFENDAIKCETQKEIKLYPIGMMFKLPYYDNMVFAIIKQRPNAYGHNHEYKIWACRDKIKDDNNFYGDNAGSKHFGGLESWSVIHAPNKDIPAYKRMLIALKKAGIKPIDFIEQKTDTDV